MHNGPHRSTQPCRGIGEAWVVSWTCIHILMHVHILPKVLDKMRGDWDMHTGQQRSAHVSVQLWKGGGADVAHQVDMHSCSDACTHSKQGLRPDE